METIKVNGKTSYSQEQKQDSTTIKIVMLQNGIAKQLSITKFEECISKAIRDEQIERGGDDANRPERGE